jgi:hypothetical protein
MSFFKNVYEVSLMNIITKEIGPDDEEDEEDFVDDEDDEDRRE